MLVFFDKKNSEVFECLSMILQEHYAIPVKLCCGAEESLNFLKEQQSKKGTCYIIHGSLGRSVRSFDDRGYSPVVHEIVEGIRDANPFARVIIFTNAYTFPWESTVKDLQADGYVTGVPSLDEWKEIFKKGEVSPDEMKRRGKDIEDVITSLESDQVIRLEGGQRNYVLRSKEGD